MKISNEVWFAAELQDLPWSDWVGDGSTKYWAISDTEARVCLKLGLPIVKTHTLTRCVFALIEHAKAARTVVSLEQDARREKLIEEWIKDGGTRESYKYGVARGWVEQEDFD